MTFLRKMNLKQYITNVLIIASITFGGMALITDKAYRDRRLINITQQKEEEIKSFSEIPSKISKQDLEKIVKKENTPKNAFERIEKDISFIHHKEGDKVLKTYPGKELLNRWYSLQELYSVKGGVCIDGAIAFCALLSDNPEYECKILILDYTKIPKEKMEIKETLDDFCEKLNPFAKQCKNQILTLLQESRGHALAFFKENNKFGYASFNDGSKGKNAVFEKTEYSDFKKFIINNFQRYESVGILEMDPKTMKFGKAIKSYVQKDKIDYYKINKIKLDRAATFKLKVEK